MRRLLAAALALALAGSALALVTSAAAPTAGELDSLMAPVALYPDQLLGEMLVSSAKPAMIGALAEWLRSQTLRGSELQNSQNTSPENKHA